MYLIRFCYDIKPTDRDAALEIVREEVSAAAAKGLSARLLIPLTRGPGGPALEYELEVERLDEVEEFRDHGIASDKSATHHWMRAFSELLVVPPTITVYRVD